MQTAGTIVISYKDRVQRISNTDEQDITNALIKLENPQQKKVYFTQGHGEHDTAGSDRLGYTTVAAAIGQDNFTVEKLVLVQQKTVPADATVIVIAGPTDGFPRARDRGAQGVSGEGRQAPRHARSAGGRTRRS